jgi:hypothetical protein
MENGVIQKIRVVEELKLYQVFGHRIIEIDPNIDDYDILGDDYEMEHQPIHSKSLSIKFGHLNAVGLYMGLFWANPFMTWSYIGLHRGSGYSHNIISKINKLSYTRNLNRRGENHFI